METHIEFPPTPQGYKRVGLSLDEKGEPQVLVCGKCSALTVNHRDHDRWHKKNG